jgi:hypothetical protein
MFKDFKSLFVKTDEEEPEKAPAPIQDYSFPVNNIPSANPVNPAPAPQPTPAQSSVTDPVVAEVLKTYESGLESINMPGYDFFEFYQTITVAGAPTEQSYKMAYQMAKIVDKNVTVEKLMHDAEFYISKINEVHSQYATQGQAKLNAVGEKKNAERTNLSNEIDQAAARIAQLREEMQKLEADIATKRSVLSKIDESYYAQEKSVKDKLSANDYAHKASIDKLNFVKEGILKFIKA